jgi:hypothetical protein
VALVQFQGLATIQAGPAAVAFGAVVVLTMFAAMSFDPRLIWDPIADASPPNRPMTEPTPSCPPPASTRRGASASRWCGSSPSWPR